jgi:hypothetical protein
MPRLGQTPDQIGTGARIGPCRDQDTQPVRLGAEAPQREAQAAHAGLVQPLQVIDDKRDRAGLRQLRQQSPDRQGHRQGINLAPAGLSALQRNSQGAALRTRKATVRALGKLADQLSKPRKRQPPVELGRRDRKHPAPADLGQLRGGPQQAALANTRIPGCNHASTSDQDVVHGPQSILAAKQPERGRYLVH